jgi:hypothetical protein
MNCACKSVGKPGCGAVVMSTEAGRPPAVTRTKPSPASTCAPAAVSVSSRDAEMVGACAAHDDVAARNRGGDQERARLDTVGDHFVVVTAERRHAFDLDDRSPRTGDFRAHLDERIGKIDDLRARVRRSRYACVRARAPPP